MQDWKTNDTICRRKEKEVSMITTVKMWQRCTIQQNVYPGNWPQSCNARYWPNEWKDFMMSKLLWVALVSGESSGRNGLRSLWYLTPNEKRFLSMTVEKCYKRCWNIPFSKTQHRSLANLQWCSFNKNKLRIVKQFVKWLRSLIRVIVARKQCLNLTYSEGGNI